MKSHRIWLMLGYLIGLTHAVCAGHPIHFGGRDSAIEVAPGAEFVLSTTTMSLDNGQVSMGNVAGTFALQGSIADNFAINPAKALSLSLNGSTQVNLAPIPLSFKRTDTLVALGANNIISVTNLLTLEGTLKVADNARLTFKFDPDYPDSVVYLKSAIPISIGKGATLEFQGGGIVQCANGTVITMAGIAGASKQSTLSLHGSALAGIDVGGTVKIGGVGTINCYDGGGFSLLHKSQLQYGTGDKDKLMLNIYNNGWLSAEVSDSNAAATDTAFISFVKGTYSINIENGGQLRAGSQGAVEINCSQGAIVNAMCQSINFDSLGVLDCEVGGVMRFCPNLVIPVKKQGIQSSIYYTEPTFSWNSLGAVVTGKGLIMLYQQAIPQQGSGSSVPPASIPLLVAQLSQDDGTTLFHNNAATMQSVVHQLIQQNPTLLTTVYFIDRNGNGEVITLNNNIELLPANSIVTGDDQSGNYTVQSPTGTDTYNANGVAQ